MAHLDLLAQVGELRHVSLGLLPDVADESLAVALQLADALVAQLRLLLQLRRLQLQRRELAQQLPVHRHKLLQSLLQGLAVGAVLLGHGVGQLAVVHAAQRVVLDLQLDHLQQQDTHMNTERKRDRERETSTTAVYA